MGEEGRPPRGSEVALDRLDAKARKLLIPGRPLMKWSTEP